MGRILKRSFKVIGVLLLLLIVAIIAIPYLFKDQIVERIKADINRTVDAKVEFADVNLSFIRSFPRFSFQLEDFKISGVDEFEGLTLAAADQASFALNLSFLFNQDQPIDIYSVQLDKPIINVKVLPDGKANYDIAKTTTDTTTGTETYDFTVKLQQYSINDAQVTFDDRFGNIYLELKDFNHSGKGDFTQEVFDFSTQTSSSSVTARYDGITYLNKAETTIDADFKANIKDMHFDLKENDIRLNAMRLLAQGFIELGWDDTTVDLKFNAPQNQFKNLLSLIPSAYSKDFADVKTTGEFQFDGMVKGKYNGSKNQYPAFNFNLDVDKGSFQYPDLPLGISNISTKATINSPSSDFDQVKVDVPQFRMKLGNNPFEAVLKLRTPISDPAVDAKIQGVINLEELSQAMPLEGVQALQGVINANMEAHTRMSAIDAQDYENVDMKGTMSIQAMNYEAEGIPPVRIKEMAMAFTPRNVKLDRFDAQMGKSDIQAKGYIDNILAYFSPEKTMSGELEVRSNYFDANEWMPEAEESPAATSSAVAEGSVEIFDRFDFKFDARVKKIMYDIYELEGCQVAGHVTPSKLAISSFRMDIGNSDISGNGLLTNWFDYVFENEMLGGKIKLSSNFLDLNQFMTTETVDGAPQAKNTADEELVPFVVPDRMAIDINADIDRLRYTNIDLRQLRGNMAVKDQSVQLQNCKANGLGGRMNVNGGYNSQNPDKPKFDLEYKLEKLNFRQAFDKLNTFAALAPIGKFIDGNFNTSLKMSGELGKDLMPDLNTLSADGFLHTLDGVIRNFKPIEQLANKLDISELKSGMKIKDSKNWFEVKDGRVEVQEFDYKLKDIGMKIKGSHGFNQNMDYRILSRIPRKMLTSNAVGAAADKGLNFLSKEASKLGLNIAQGEFINVQINLTGSLTDPKVNIRPLGADGEAVDNPVNNAVDQVKEEINKEKEKAVAEVKKEVEETKTVVVDEAKKGAKDAVDSLLTNPNSLKDKPADILGNIKDKLGNKEKKEGEETKKEEEEKPLDEVKNKANNLLKKFGKKKKKDENG
ncbi:MAG: AsmA-like C-terminal region-containing protein [Bacteroidota bacterium]